MQPKEERLVGYMDSGGWRHNRRVVLDGGYAYIVVVVVVLVVWQIVILLHLFLNDSRDCCITAHNICIRDAAAAAAMPVVVRSFSGEEPER